MAKIYVSSSWSNPYQRHLVEALRQRSHDVYDFCRPNGREDKNVWDLLGINKDGIQVSEFRDLMLDAYVQSRFNEHVEAMMDSDVCILLLPCNRSSHIEAGIMKGHGKPVLVLCNGDEPFKPELMYLFFDEIFDTEEELFTAITKYEQHQQP